MIIQTKFGEFEISYDSKVTARKHEISIDFVAMSNDDICKMKKAFGIEDENFLSKSSMYVVTEKGKAHFVKYIGSPRVTNVFRESLYNQFITISRMGFVEVYEDEERPLYLIDILMSENALELSIRY